MRKRYQKVMWLLVVLAVVCSLVAIASAPMAGASFTAGPCATSPTWPGLGPPAVTWSTQSAYPGQVIIGNGSGFQPGASITVTLNGIAVTASSPVVAGTDESPYDWGNGTWIASFKLPNLPAGNYTAALVNGLRAAGGATSSCADWFRIVPKINVSPTYGSVGTSVTITGVGFTYPGTVTTALYLSDGITPAGALITSPLPMVVNSNGTLSGTFNMPEPTQHDPAGNYTVKVTDSAGKGNSTNFQLTIYSPTLTISPAGGPQSIAVNVHGHHFPASTDVAISFAGSPIDLVCVGTGTPILSGSYIVGVRTTATGTFDVSFQVPAAAPYGTVEVAVSQITAVGHPPTVGIRFPALPAFTVYDAPRFPVDNPIGIGCEYWHQSEPYSTGHRPAGYYSLNEYQEPLGGLWGADDTYALDLNWESGSSDLGKPVYAIQRGVIEQVDRAWGWVLIKHNTTLEWEGQTYDTWYSGYLHMRNIPKNLAHGISVQRSMQIGEVAGVAKNTTYSPHLHFAIYVGQIVKSNRPNPFLESADPGQVLGPAYAGYIYGDAESIYSWGSGAIYNHNVDELVGQDAKNWFEKGGTESDWFGTTIYGFYNHMFYSHTEKSNPDNWGRWNHILLADGEFTVLAFIPGKFHDTTNATYVISCNGEVVLSKTVSQTIPSDQWYELGKVDGKTGDRIDVYLADKTGGKGKYIAYDAIKIWMKQDVPLPRS